MVKQTWHYKFTVFDHNTYISRGLINAYSKSKYRVSVMMLLLLEMNFVIRINVVPLTAGCLVHFNKEGLILEFLEFYAP